MRVVAQNISPVWFHSPPLSALCPSLPATGFRPLCTPSVYRSETTDIKDMGGSGGGEKTVNSSQKRVSRIRPAVDRSLLLWGARRPSGRLLTVTSSWVRQRRTLPTPRANACFQLLVFWTWGFWHWKGSVCMLTEAREKNIQYYTQPINWTSLTRLEL